MKTVNQIRVLIVKSGGTLEEDEGLRDDTRIFQAVAPDWQVWRASDTHCMIVYWARGSSEQIQKLNEESYRDLAQRLAFGLRDMTESERDLCAED